MVPYLISIVWMLTATENFQGTSQPENLSAMGIIMAVIIFGSSEKMGLSFYLGTLIIMSAVASYPIFRKKYDGGIIVNQ